ncbi:plasma membrane iron permease [Lichtheimia corymbifera JMRC:FSU:9682]|uniref:Plasma membrane iron permease n=1 Tax=Lichtheimia corymbifera JMRC:FSU:9682 TaxID=1263082 RepID=A0A068RUM8_9FUNG|nr:plasma membrane iron permease [Lichtheimia corymbifera JMRC:FSU:9682]
MSQDLFYVPIFFIIFREVTEAAIIVSVLLSFLSRIFDPSTLVYKRLRKQVWWGTAIGLAICLCIGGAFIAVFYTLLNNLWGETEYIWEALFCILATILITMMGLAMLKTEHMQEEWKVKLAKVIESKRQANEGTSTKLQRYSFFVLPFITVLREGLEAVVFIGGISLNAQAKSIPIPVLMGFLCGCLVGYIIYRGGNLVRLRWFFIVSTIILYLVAAGLLSRGVGFIEQYEWNKVIGGEAAEEGGDVIGYKVTTAIWHVSWGDPEKNLPSTGGYQIFNSVLGWNNTATYGTIITYCLYWLVVIGFLVYFYYDEKRSAIRKAEAGEWQAGDLALENAKGYIDEETGEIKKDKGEKHDIEHIESNGAYHVERVVLPPPTQ